jgi:hypothetical protein
VILLAYFEANYHQEGMARERLEEKFLVVNFYLPVDLT